MRISREKGKRGLTIDFAGTLLLHKNRAAIEIHGKPRSLTITNGIFQGVLGGRLRASWAALKWIWKAT